MNAEFNCFREWIPRPVLQNGLLHKVNINMFISKKRIRGSNCKGQEQMMDNDDKIVLLLGSLGNLK